MPIPPPKHNLLIPLPLPLPQKNPKQRIPHPRRRVSPLPDLLRVEVLQDTELPLVGGVRVVLVGAVGVHVAVQVGMGEGAGGVFCFFFVLRGRGMRGGLGE